MGTPIAPCDCCSFGDPRCAVVATRFNAVAQTVAQAGWGQVNLPGTIDGVSATTALSGYNSPGGFVTSTTLEVTYTLTVPHNRVRGLRLWSQAGGDLNDADGLGQFTAEFYAGAVLLSSQVFSGANGGQAMDLMIPGNVALDGVDRVVLRNLGKLSGSSVAPLWRELQLLELNTVWPCRHGNGTVQWHDANGIVVPLGDLSGCDQPVMVPDLLLTGGGFNDDPSGQAENLCNVSPTPDVVAGWAAPVGGCYDPVTAAPTMSWNTPLSGVQVDYGHATQASGASIITFSSPALGATISWPANGASMALGETRWSNVFGGIYRARLTYVSGYPGQSGSPFTVRLLGGGAIWLHEAVVSVSPFIRVRLDFFHI